MRWLAALFSRVGPRRQTIKLEWNEPTGLSREDDPTYRLFERYKRERQRSSDWVCEVAGCPNTDIQAHHILPFALSWGVDVNKLNAARGTALTAESYRAWVNGSANLETLCAAHHALKHAIPGPAWEALIVYRADLPPPVRVLKGAEAQQ